jgi:alkanesulfonate monooxygenase SsuD/methylene tetrahydromethanopterin reductase-like flavin-dependent oxidoreductase (luciferase family)
VLTEIALRTARIYLDSGVLSVWGRTPATLAMTAATLHQVCGGRYVLGLGASTKALVAGFHDTAFEHPAAKLRDVVTKVRALLADQPAQLGHAPAARSLRLGQPAAEVPIWVAALGHHTIRVAAKLGDGWIPALVARDRLPGGTRADALREHVLGRGRVLPPGQVRSRRARLLARPAAAAAARPAFRRLLPWQVISDRGHRRVPRVAGDQPLQPRDPLRQSRVLRLQRRDLRILILQQHP